jgi:hypothetical protein
LQAATKAFYANKTVLCDKHGLNAGWLATSEKLIGTHNAYWKTSLSSNNLLDIAIVSYQFRFQDMRLTKCEAEFDFANNTAVH